MPAIGAARWEDQRMNKRKQVAAAKHRARRRKTKIRARVAR